MARRISGIQTPEKRRPRRGDGVHDDLAASSVAWCGVERCRLRWARPRRGLCSLCATEPTVCAGVRVSLDVVRRASDVVGSVSTLRWPTAIRTLHPRPLPLMATNHRALSSRPLCCCRRRWPRPQSRPRSPGDELARDWSKISNFSWSGGASRRNLLATDRTGPANGPTTGDSE